MVDKYLNAFDESITDFFRLPDTFLHKSAGLYTRRHGKGTIYVRGWIYDWKGYNIVVTIY